MNVERRDFHVWIDVADTLCHNIRFQLTERTVQGVDLAVDVGWFDGVAIDKRDMSNGRSGKRFRYP